MARRVAMLRLHKSLVARRTELRKRLGGELKDLRNFQAGDPTGDSADLAFVCGPVCSDISMTSLPQSFQVALDFGTALLNQAFCAEPSIVRPGV